MARLALLEHGSTQSGITRAAGLSHSGKKESRKRKNCFTIKLQRPALRYLLVYRKQETQQ
jgi:hypothetical protein